jgi:hypothetical protein
MADFGGGGEVNARIVYWGVEGAGKLTNLRVIHSKLRPDHRGELSQVPTRLDPTVSYAVLPIELGEIGGVRTRIQILAVPGAPEHAPTRKQLLDRADGVVFVVDTTRERLDENLQSFDELRGALAAYGRALEDVPLVIQYNKRDQEDPFALEELHRKLSMRGVAAFEAVAAQGTAVLQTLTTISKRVIRQLREREPAAQAPPDATRVLETVPQPPRPPAREAALPRALPLEPDLLGEPDAASARTAAEAQSIFEPSFHAARTQLDLDAELPAPEGASAPPAEAFQVESAGPVALAGPGALRVPLVVRDESGRRRRLTLTLRLDPEESGG